METSAFHLKQHFGGQAPSQVHQSKPAKCSRVLHRTEDERGAVLACFAPSPVPPDQVLQAASVPRLWPWKTALPLAMALNDGLYHFLSSPFTVMLRQTSSFLLHSTERDCQNRKGIFLSLRFLTCAGCMVRDEQEWQILTIHPQPLRESIHLFLVHATSFPAPAFQCLQHCKILPYGHQFLILVFLLNVKGLMCNLCCAFTSTKKIAFQRWDRYLITRK